MPEITQKELDILNVKASLLGMVREMGLIARRQNELQNLIAQGETELNKLEVELKKEKEDVGKVTEVKQKPL